MCGYFPDGLQSAGLQKIQVSSSLPSPLISVSPEAAGTRKPFQNKYGAAPFLIGGVTMFLVGGFASYEFAMQKRRLLEYQKRLSQGEVMSTEGWDATEKYNEIAKEYDTSSPEFFLGLTFLRWWTTRQAKGKVLEVCAGTGKNVPYYNPSRVTEIHFVDQSPKMLEQCKEKWEKSGKDISAKFIVSSIESLSIPAVKYDTVYQTQGLCSCADPVAELRQLQRLVKPNGKIILIEHGRGYYDWINNVLDSIWEDHAKRWGCITNRDIGKILKESGIIVEKKSRWHFGTTWVIIAKPAPEKGS